jgi:hypothetical protein
MIAIMLPWGVIVRRLLVILQIPINLRVLEVEFRGLIGAGGFRLRAFQEMSFKRIFNVISVTRRQFDQA